MGVVYEAEDTRLGRRVALKVLTDKLACNPGANRMLAREGETMARLDHPHICRVHEAGVENGRGFIVMERLEGMNLRARMARKSLETGEIVAVATQVAEALHAVHAAGIVHCDVKPGNIFLTSAGRVKLLDFGLATRLGRRVHGEAPGRPLGTANYMAPERIRQTGPDPRSDLFSLGVVMYEMATGRLPFAGDSPSETVTNVLTTNPIPARALSPTRPVALDRIVHKLLAKNADDRYASAAELKKALRGIGRQRRPTLAVSLDEGLPTRSRKEASHASRETLDT
jgi:serine/threonine protein kinase